MSIAHLYRIVQDGAGNVVPGTQVSLCEPGTDALIADVLYADSTLQTEIPNPFNTPDGVIDVYLARPRTVLLKTVLGSTTVLTDYLDLLPPAETVLAATGSITIDNDAFPGAVLQMEDADTAHWVDPVSFTPSGNGVVITGASVAGPTPTSISSTLPGPGTSVAMGLGSVAIGTDSGGASANAPFDNDFVLGTPLHQLHLDGNVGFFGATPVGKQPAPTSLADVIAGLRALGLFS